MVDAIELTSYEVGYLCGGADRVAMVVLVGLHADGRIRVSADRCRVHVVRRSWRDEVEKAALEVVPDVGRVLGLTMLMVAASAPVQKVGRGLREKKLMPSSRLGALWQWGRAKRARDLRRRWADAPAADGLERVAIEGAPGIADEELRRIFETHKYEPPASVKLTNPRLGAAYDPLHSTGTPDRSADLDRATYYTGGPF
jgi:hypothetical protein